MWLVRNSSMLVLIVALLLPPGLFRDCCCKQKAAAQRTSNARVRTCCLARMKSSRAEKLAEATPVRLKSRSCQCKPAAAPVAVIAEKASRSTSGSDGPLTFAFRFPTVTWQSPLSALTVGNSIRNDHLIGPPVRKTLCRWLV